MQEHIWHHNGVARQDRLYVRNCEAGVRLSTLNWKGHRVWVWIQGMCITASLDGDVYHVAPLYGVQTVDTFKPVETMHCDLGLQEISHRVNVEKYVRQGYESVRNEFGVYETVPMERLKQAYVLFTNRFTRIPTAEDLHEEMYVCDDFWLEAMEDDFHDKLKGGWEQQTIPGVNSGGKMTFRVYKQPKGEGHVDQEDQEDREDVALEIHCTANQARKLARVFRPANFSVGERADGRAKIELLRY